ncbi:MAG: hypothetical protein VW683_11585 [Betaproteobacteria bacterium]|jgi:hypothetical protein
MSVVEHKTLCLVRVPPGDRWKEPNGTEVFENLTNALEHIFQINGCVEYRFSAGEGKIWSITMEEQAPTPPKRYSIYGEYFGND